MSDKHSMFSEFVSENSNHMLLERESLALAATELICKLMEEHNISKADLAGKLNKSRAFITQVLSGNRNLTLHTFSDLAFQLGYRIEIDAVPLSQAMDDQGYTLRYEFPHTSQNIWKEPSEKNVKENDDGILVA